MALVARGTEPIAVIQVVGRLLPLAAVKVLALKTAPELDSPDVFSLAARACLAQRIPSSPVSRPLRAVDVRRSVVECGIRSLAAFPKGLWVFSGPGPSRR